MRRRPVAIAIATATSTALGLALVRVLIPLLFGVREADGIVPAIATAVLVFAAPALAPCLQWAIGARWARNSTWLGLAIASVLVQFVHPVPVWLGATATGLALVSWTFLLVEARSEGSAGGTGFAMSFVAGTAIDTAILGLAGTWSVLWRSGPEAASTVILASAFLAAAWITTTAGLATREARSIRVLPVAGLGPFLALQVLLVGNVAFLVALAGISIAAGTAIVLAGEAAAALAIVILARAGEPPRWLTVAGAGTLAVLVWALPSTAGSPLAAIVLVTIGATAIAGLLMTIAIARGGEPDRRAPGRTAMALTIGMIAFLALVFADQIDATNPLPVDADLLGVVAALGLGGAAVAGGHRRSTSHHLDRWVAAIPLAALAIAPAVIATSAPMPHTEPSAARTVRILSWNVHAGVDGAGQVDPEILALTITSLEPDVIMLQEVSRGWPIGGGLDLASWLSARLDMAFAWAPAADERFGNLIMTSLPILGVRAVDLPYGTGPQRRSALQVAVDVGRHRVRIVGTHLETGTGSDTRARQIDALLAAFGDRPSTVVAGDMNLQPSTDLADVGSFTRAGFDSAQDVAGDPSASTARRPAFPGDRPDWIFATRDLALSDFTIARSEASDHLPLAVTVTVSR